MKNTRRILLLLGGGMLWWTALSGVQAAIMGQLISVRLVAAVTGRVSAGGIDTAVATVDSSKMNRDADAKALSDVLPLLRGNLGFSKYQLVNQRQMTVEDGATADLGEALTLEIGNVGARHCTIRISRHGQELLSTRVRLAPGRPLVLGGFPAGAGARTLMVVITP